MAAQREIRVLGSPLRNPRSNAEPASGPLDFDDDDASNVFAQSWQLTFIEEDIEQRFVLFSRPSLTRVLPVISGLLLLLSCLLAISGDFFFYLRNIVVFLVIFAASIALQPLWKNASPSRQSQILAVEAVLLLVLALYVIIGDLVVTFEWQADHCPDNIANKIDLDSTAVYVDAHCTRWWTPFAVGSLVVVMQVKILTLVPMGLLAALVVPVPLVLHDIPGLSQPNPYVQVYLQTVYFALGASFAVFVHYDYEATQRQQFIRGQLLERERELLQRNRIRLTQLCHMMIPSALLKRLNQHNPDAPIDYSAVAAVLVAGIHDFEHWCTTVRPHDAALVVADLSNCTRRIAKQNDVEVIGSMGDTYLVVGNLIHHVPHVGAKAARTGIEVLDLEETRHFPPLHAAVHVGALQGGFIGGRHAVRYDVFGPALDVTRWAFREAGPDTLLISDSAKAHCVEVGLLPAEQASSLVSIDVNGVAFSIGQRLAENLAGTPPSAFDSHSTNASVGKGHDHELGPEQEAALHQVTSPSPSQIRSPVMPHSPASDNYVDANEERHQRNPLERRGGGPLDQTPSPSRASRVAATSATQQLDQYRDMRTVWCCFEEFADAQSEHEYAQERMKSLPRAASRTWYAYAVYVTGLIGLYLADSPMSGDDSNAPAVLTLLLMSVLSAITMATTPNLLSQETMLKWFLPWSIAGALIPLLTVFGCAAGRPSAVGNDVWLHVIVGAVVRTFCFTNMRWQVTAVPIAVLAAMGQYALPGARFRYVLILFVFVAIAATLIAQKGRESAQRNDMRRGAEILNLVSQLRAVEGLRSRLLATTLPPRAYEAMKKIKSGRAATEPQLIAYEVPNGIVMLVRWSPQPHPGASSHGASMSGSAQNTSATSSNMPYAGQQVVDHFAGVAEMLQRIPILSFATIVGDDALIAGPIVVIPGHRHNNDVESEQALVAAVPLAFNIVRQALPPATGVTDDIGSVSVNSLSHEGSGSDSRRHSTVSSNTAHFTVLMDFDSVVHAVRLGFNASYTLLGPVTARLLAIVNGVDPAALSGVVVTDRVVSAATRAGSLCNVDATPLGRMKIRGAGIQRLTRLAKK